MPQDGESFESSEMEAAAASLPMYLKGVGYPVDKKHLIEHARSHQAPQVVLKLLGKIADMVYDHPVELDDQVEKIL